MSSVAPTTSSVVPRDPPRRRSRWFTFSLRSLLVLVTTFCLFCGWFGVQKRAYDAEQQLLHRMEQGGHVSVFDSDPFSKLVSLLTPFTPDVPLWSDDWEFAHLKIWITWQGPRWLEKPLRTVGAPIFDRATHAELVVYPPAAIPVPLQSAATENLGKLGSLKSVVVIVNPSPEPGAEPRGLKQIRRALYAARPDIEWTIDRVGPVDLIQ